MDTKKIITGIYLAASMLLWLLSRVFLQYLHLTFYQFRRLPGVGVLKEALPLVLGVALFLIFLNNAKISLFIEEAVAELKKVSWPSRTDVVKSTWVVLICIVIASFFLASFDVVWGKVMTYLLHS